MTTRQIDAALEPIGVRRFDAIEAARCRILGNNYPRGSRGRVAYHGTIGASLDRCGPLSLRQWKAAYALARATLA